ncbi:hypothetical protein FQR65_LT16648 [Abscondita terminalis]|nr:hypothetical protein FQR65_LT16648 [Abscondita terminalis]
MARTNDGFKCAEVDLQLRGPGDISGTQQSGVLDMKIANLASDQAILSEARNAVISIFKEDPALQSEKNILLSAYLKQRAPVLISVITPDTTEAKAREISKNCTFLVETAEGLPTWQMEEIKSYIDAEEIDMVVFDDELSPSQLRNYRKLFQSKDSGPFQSDSGYICQSRQNIHRQRLRLERPQLQVHPSPIDTQVDALERQRVIKQKKKSVNSLQPFAYAHHMNKKVQFTDWGLQDYQDAWNRQEEIFKSILDIKHDNRVNEAHTETSNYLIFTEHPHVYTLGKSGHPDNLLLDEQGLEEKQATFYKINRAETSTTRYGHCSYPYLDLRQFLHAFTFISVPWREAIILNLGLWNSGRQIPGLQAYG